MKDRYTQEYLQKFKERSEANKIKKPINKFEEDLRNQTLKLDRDTYKRTSNSLETLNKIHSRQKEISAELLSQTEKLDSIQSQSVQFYNNTEDCQELTKEIKKAKSIMGKYGLSAIKHRILNVFGSNKSKKTILDQSLNTKSNYLKIKDVEREDDCIDLNNIDNSNGNEEKTIYEDRINNNLKKILTVVKDMKQESVTQCDMIRSHNEKIDTISKVNKKGKEIIDVNLEKLNRM